MEKAELLITPGCEAGSEYCWPCTRFAARDVFECLPFGEKLELEYEAEENEPILRCTPCLEAEAKLKELREKIERLEEESTMLKLKLKQAESFIYKDTLPKVCQQCFGSGIAYMPDNSTAGTHKIQCPSCRGRREK